MHLRSLYSFIEKLIEFPGALYPQPFQCGNDRFSLRSMVVHERGKYYGPLGSKVIFPGVGHARAAMDSLALGRVLR